MGTIIRPEVSQESRYWIDRHRYYELKHFCLQYPLWKSAYARLDGYSDKSTSVTAMPETQDVSSPTERYASLRVYLSERMDMVEKAAEDTDPIIGRYLLHAVTEGLGYDALKAKGGVPCCKENYYELYRRFFWLLSKARR